MSTTKPVVGYVFLYTYDRGPRGAMKPLNGPFSHGPIHNLALSLLRATLPCLAPQLFYSFFKTLVGKEIAVELKNDVALTGTLHSVDQYLNVKLTDVHVVDAERYPQLVRRGGGDNLVLFYYI